MYEYGGADGYADVGGDGSSGSGEDGLVGALRQMARGGEAVAGLRLPGLRNFRRRVAQDNNESSGDSEALEDHEDGPGEEVPDLGEDTLAVRLRATAARAAGATPPEARLNYAELRRRVQVDLNREENLGDLEDPQLVEHMRRKREERAALEAARAALPPRASLRREDTAGRRALSALTTQLKEQQMALQCASDEVHAHATNAGKYAAGGQPHGYPPVAGPQAPVLEHLQKRLMAAVDSVGDVLAALGAFERDLALTRRHYETVVDGLGRWCAYYEGEGEGAG